MPGQKLDPGKEVQADGLGTRTGALPVFRASMVATASGVRETSKVSKFFAMHLCSGRRGGDARACFKGLTSGDVVCR